MPKIRFEIEPMWDGNTSTVRYYVYAVSRCGEFGTEFRARVDGIEARSEVAAVSDLAEILGRFAPPVEQDGQ